LACHLFLFPADAKLTCICFVILFCLGDNIKKARGVFMYNQEGKTIQWYEWGKEAFNEANKKKKPILLSITGTWCHWCHVMEETTYSDPEVIAKVEESYIPVKVDTDRRPDINARYNLGGWPTTAFLTPEGELITGGTYLPPGEMVEVLENVESHYRSRPSGIGKEHGQEDREKERKRMAVPTRETYRIGEGIYETETFADLIGFVASQLQRNFDQEYGGFGRAPKFPMVEALELSQIAFLYEGDKKWERIFAHTLRSMYSGGIFDPVEGGFFRYSTTRDWSIPHFEKMLEDNARLLSVLLTSYKLTDDEVFAQASREVLSYLENNLYLSGMEGWAGSQDADEEYYSLSLEGRRQRSKPGIDETIYVNWNAMLIRSLFSAAVILAEPKWYDLAMTTLRMLGSRCYEADKGMAHYLIAGKEKARLWGMLEDQAAMGLALSAAYQHSGEEHWLGMARQLARYCLEYLSTGEGCLRDKPVHVEELGMLAEPVFDLRNNALCACWFVEMAGLTGEDAYLEKAADIVHSFTEEYRQHPLLSAGLALSALGVREPAAVIEVMGAKNDPAVLKLHSTALAEVIPPKVVKLLSPEQAREKKGRGVNSKKGTAAAYACMGKHCFEPAESPEELQQVVHKMVKERRAHVLFTVKESSKVR
jgi:uncharacterized protein YyaL (SSP411 family)